MKPFTAHKKTYSLQKCKMSWNIHLKKSHQFVTSKNLNKTQFIHFIFYIIILWSAIYSN